MPRPRLLPWLVVLLLASGAVRPAHAETPAEKGAPSAEDAESLAKASQNPLGSLISVPFENNFYFGIGPADSLGYVLTLKPVYPVRFSRVNLINRFIVPVIRQEGQDLGLEAEDAPSIEFGFTSGTTVPRESTFGLGNITWQGFLTPSKSPGFTFGAGPALSLPTNTSPSLGTDKWTLGPAVVALVKPGPWVVGGLVQQSWSFAGPSSASRVSTATLQYFLNYNFGQGWYLSSTPVMTANWTAPSGEKWTVPVGGGGGKLHRFGKLPIDFKLVAYWNAVRPRFGPDWQLQFNVKLLFPKPS